MAADFADARANMVNGQVIVAGITDRQLIAALSAVPRERFVSSRLESSAYSDCDIPLSKPSSTLARRYLIAARSFARLVQAARIGPRDLVLDVACATGYSSAVLSLLANTVVALEDDEGFADQAAETLGDLGANNVAVVIGPLEYGWPAAAPFDAIFIGGSVGAIPVAFVDQLNVGGRLVTVLGDGLAASGTVFVKTPNSFSGRPVFNAAVPRLPGFADERSSFSDRFFGR